MKRRTISIVAVGLAASALSLWSAGAALAQHHDGGHGGGSHAAYHGGGTWHGGSGGWHGGYYGGEHHGWDGGWHHGSFWWGYPFYGGLGLGFYRPYYYGGASWPYYYGGSWPYYGWNTGSYLYDYPSANIYTYPSAEMATAEPPLTGYNSLYPPDTSSTEATPATAEVDVRVPANAEVFFNGQQMTQTGSLREFVTPSLDPNRNYSYVVQAHWNQNGREVTRTQNVPIHAGDHVTVSFLNTQASTPTNQNQQALPENPPPKPAPGIPAGTGSQRMKPSSPSGAPVP
jgi:uncharacterized protein (TIGR03000 family)